MTAHKPFRDTEGRMRHSRSFVEVPVRAGNNSRIVKIAEACYQGELAQGGLTRVSTEALALATEGKAWAAPK